MAFMTADAFAEEALVDVVTEDKLKFFGSRPRLKGNVYRE